MQENHRKRMNFHTGEHAGCTGCTSIKEANFISDIFHYSLEEMHHVDPLIVC